MVTNIEEGKHNSNLLNSGLRLTMSKEIFSKVKY